MTETVDKHDDVTWKQVRLRLERNIADVAEAVRKLIVARKLDEAIKTIESQGRTQVTLYENIRSAVSTTAIFPVSEAE